MSLLRKTAVLALASLSLASTAAAQSHQPRPDMFVMLQQQAQTTQVDREPARTLILEGQNADQTRESLRRLLRQYPPTLHEILRRDPSLLNNAAYLTPYPALAAFLSQHPEVAHNPVYFLGSAERDPYQINDPASVKARAIENVFESITVVTAFLGFFMLIGFVTKSVIEQRRWTRASKMQTEAHSKVIDRLASNEDLLAYIQTPAGQRYLESMPPVAAGAVSEGPTTAPYSRILWSVQAGTVGTVVGLGFLFVASRWATFEDWSGEFSRMLFLVGVVTLAAGVGFILSGLASAILSRRFGLIPASTHHA